MCFGGWGGGVEGCGEGGEVVMGRRWDFFFSLRGVLRYGFTGLIVWYRYGIYMCHTGSHPYSQALLALPHHFHCCPLPSLH